MPINLSQNDKTQSQVMIPMCLVVISVDLCNTNATVVLRVVVQISIFIANI